MKKNPIILSDPIKHNLYQKMSIKLIKLDDYRWLIPKTGAMHVPGLIFSNSTLIKTLKKDQSLTQIVNVATLPGIVGHALAMPDVHWGYGFPIGGVAAFDLDEGIISPGGVGYDINCGCRLMTTRLTADEVRPEIKDLVTALFKNIPAGVGSTGRIHLSKKDEAKGIYVQSRGRRTLKEEMPEAYKDISQVVEAVHGPGLASKVARLRPLGVIKG